MSLADDEYEIFYNYKSITNNAINFPLDVTRLIKLFLHFREDRSSEVLLVVSSSIFTYFSYVLILNKIFEIIGGCNT